MIESVAMITNADEGILMSWEAPYASADWSDWQPHMAVVSGGAASVVTPGGGFHTVTPVLQLEDGSFVGTASSGSYDPWAANQMIAFDSTGAVRWSAAGYSPKIATSGGGVLATNDTGSAVLFDEDGRATAQSGTPLTYSWLQNAYRTGSVVHVLADALPIATSWWPFGGASASGNNSAAQQPWFAPLQSCPGAATPCPQEAAMSALNQLRTLLAVPCSNCDTYVFSELAGTDRVSFSKYLARPPRFFDGTRSYAPANIAFCRAGWWSQLWCNFSPQETVRAYMQRMGSDAASQTPSDSGKGMQVFFNPAPGICNVLASPNPPSGDQGVLNQATLFHEALHGYTGVFDLGLQVAFGLPFGGSANITYYLEDNVIPGGAQGARQCGN